MPRTREQRILSSGLGHYSDYREFANTTAVIAELMFTHAILSDVTETGYGDRWCYKTYTEAKKALDAWDGEGEPAGWHRHPTTGRRRENGDPNKQTINW